MRAESVRNLLLGDFERFSEILGPFPISYVLPKWDERDKCNQRWNPHGASLCHLVQNQEFLAINIITHTPQEDSCVINKHLHVFPYGTCICLHIYTCIFLHVHTCTLFTQLPGCSI